MVHRGIALALLVVLAGIPVGVLGAGVASRTFYPFGYGISPSNAGPGAALTEGERIYRAGVRGGLNEIPRRVGGITADALAMVGCARCHGTYGTGGPVPVIVGSAFAPPVTFAGCIAAGYTESTLRSAIRDGVGSHGRPLSAIMPRWHMTDAELDALVAHLKVLSLH